MNGTRSIALPPDRGADELLACFFFFSLAPVINSSRFAKTVFEMSTPDVAGPFKF